MLRAARLVAFVATAAPERARAFYENVLGLTLVADEPSALVFDASGIALRVAKVRSLEPSSYTVLGWRVDDVRAAVRDLRAAGVVFERYAQLEQDELGVWRAPGGALVAWFRDPDGNLLSLTQE